MMQLNSTSALLREAGEPTVLPVLERCMHLVIVEDDRAPKDLVTMVEQTDVSALFLSDSQAVRLTEAFANIKALATALDECEPTTPVRQVAPASSAPMFGTPEEGHRLARHGFGGTDEEIAAAAAPDSDISKEIAAARARVSASAPTIAVVPCSQSDTAGADVASTRNHGEPLPMSGAGTEGERDAAHIDAIVALGEEVDRVEAKDQLQTLIWRGGSPGLRRLALEALQQLSRLDDDWDRRQTQKTLGLYVQTHQQDPLNSEIIATANAIVKLGWKERDEELRRRFSCPSLAVPPILWPFLASIAALLVVGLAGSVAGSLVGVVAGILTWWLTMVLLMRGIQGK